ncbi:MAG: glycosyl hydrolase 108 family protein [Bryobacteraceae bacterium]
MADFQPAVAITLRNEGGFYHNQVTGEIVNYGVTLKFVRESGYKTDADEAFIRNLTESEASGIYQTYFWNRYHIGSLHDQALANKVFDLTVNMGPGSAARPGALILLQDAVNTCGGQCAVDGVLGPHTISQVNALDPVVLLGRYRESAKARYTQIAAGNPELAGDLNGWLARLNA